MPKLTPVYHVTPKDDIYRHVVDRKGSCWCCPVLDDTDPEEITFMHNSYDRREDYEEGLRKPH